jgi:hypothetical protein
MARRFGDSIDRRDYAAIATPETFATKAADATEYGMILETANACTPATAQADRVKISAFQWRAAKLKPKIYGDKAEIAVTGADRGPVQSVTVSVTDPIEAARVYQKFMSGDG